MEKLKRLLKALFVVLIPLCIIAVVIFLPIYLLETYFGATAALVYGFIVLIAGLTTFVYFLLGT